MKDKSTEVKNPAPKRARSNRGITKSRTSLILGFLKKQASTSHSFTSLAAEAEFPETSEGEREKQ